jgi:hypothetical protein
VDPTPENIERLLATWIDGKACGICGRLLTPSDWRLGRLAVLDGNFKMLEMRQIELTQLWPTLEHTRPLCWTCHQDERVRQALPHRVLKGERLPVTTAIPH